MATYSKSAKTKRHIYDVAQKLFAENGYNETSLADIAATAGVSTGTLYRHFPTKGDLLMQSRRYSLDRLHDQVGGIPRNVPIADRLITLALTDLHGLQEDEASTSNALSLASLSETYASLEHLRLEYSTRCELIGLYQGLIEEAQEAGECSCAIDAYTLAAITVAIYFQELDCLIADEDHDFEASLSAKVHALFEAL